MGDAPKSLNNSFVTGDGTRCRTKPNFSYGIRSWQERCKAPSDSDVDSSLYYLLPTLIPLGIKPLKNIVEEVKNITVTSMFSFSNDVFYHVRDRFDVLNNTDFCLSATTCTFSLHNAEILSSDKL